ncbi:cytochrome P450 monooxygenase pc-1, partial [Mycena pura]
SPGVAFLARITIRVLSKPIIVGLGVHFASQRAGLALPVSATVILAVASVPLYVAYRVWREDRRQREEAAVMGARLAPSVPGKRFGNWDLLQIIMHNRAHGYPAGDWFDELMAQYGPVISVRVLWTDTLLTAWPEHIKQILATDFDNYEKGITSANRPQSGVFNSDGEMWKFHRAMTRPFFSKEKVSHFDIFDHHADLVVSIMKSRLRAGYSVDFQDLIGRFTMDSASEFLFGTCANSLRANIPYAHNVASPPVQHTSADANKFIEAFNESMQIIAEREHIGSIWPLWEMRCDKTKAPMQVVNAFLEPVIQAAVEKREEKAKAVGGAEKAGEAETLLEELLNSTSAGRDTTMHVMTMVVYLCASRGSGVHPLTSAPSLSMYPAVCARLRAEVLAHLGPTRRPTYDDIKDMKYLRAVINESMRLYPSVPFNVRDSIRATTWPSPDPTEKPIYIPARAKTAYSVFMMHRRKDMWGPDAEEFDPDRFLDERLKKYLLNNSFQFLPFNAGPRICLGQQFAYNEMSFMLIRLLQAFRSFALDEAAFPPAARPPAAWKGAPGRKGIDRFRPKLHLTMYTTVRASCRALSDADLFAVV